ncbi:membrane protein [Streptomyces filipinensis]|uniref:Membrane protein n=1 Tax=Streptomyces filipinensis TaxID=66887 RepID=A0A918I8C1_9ACTN|nr:membrane protein [Streptomyces filipinensis]
MRELLLVGVVIVLGLCGVLVPGVPGSWLVWAAVLWWALTDPRPLAWAVLVGAGAVLLLSLAVRAALPRRRLRESGATPRMAVYAGAGALLGFVLLPVLGALPGFVAGIYLHERLRLGGHGEAMASLRTTMRSGGSSVLTELFACLLIAAAWLGAVLWG